MKTKKKDDSNDETWIDENNSSMTSSSQRRRDLIINSLVVALLGASGVASWSLFQTNVYTPSGFTRIYPTQFIAALGDPQASQGSAGSATTWGIWKQDPGPRGVWLEDYQQVLSNTNNLNHQAPAGWIFDEKDWWLEEHGLIMEAPQFPLSPGRYLVTGGRMLTTGLTIGRDGSWKLDEGTLYDVTHLPCRSARYTPDLENSNNDGIIGSPLTANPRNFPVAPGAEMPLVKGCHKQDYAVLFVVGKA